MSIDKYQKSMLKIYEELLLNLDKPLIIEELIQKTNVGRTSAYEALGFMEKHGFIIIKEIGKQKQVLLKKDPYTLAFKEFADGFAFKQIPRDIKFTISLFLEQVKKLSGVKAVLLFGSALTVKLPNDIDLIIVHDESIDKNQVEKIRNKIELFSSFIINTHYDYRPTTERILHSVCLSGFDHILSILLRKRKDIIELNDVVEWLDCAFANMKDSAYFNDCLEKSLINLSYVYCYSADIYPKTKEEAKIFLLEKYPELKKLHKIKMEHKIDLMKKVVKELGRELFN